MAKTHLTAKTGSPAVSPMDAARVRQSAPKLDQAPESPLMRSAFDDEACDWADESGDDAACRWVGYSEQADRLLAPDVETEISLLLHGVSYR